MIIDEFGGWRLFQRLLVALRDIAATHTTTIGAVALNHVLNQAGVSAAIVGARSTAHLAPTVAALSVTLSAAERSVISALLNEATGPSGDVYSIERDKSGRHASIMRYNLNTK